MTLREVIAEAYVFEMSFTKRCDANAVVSRAMHTHPEVFFQQSARLIQRAAKREAQAFMKEQEPASQEDINSVNQLELPLGILPGLRTPRTLIVEKPMGGYEHVCYEAATWSDLESADHEKSLNIERAIARKEDHMRKMDVLRPIMRDHPDMTVAEACELLRKDQV